MENEKVTKGNPSGDDRVPDRIAYEPTQRKEPKIALSYGATLQDSIIAQVFYKYKSQSGEKNAKNTAKTAGVEVLYEEAANLVLDKSYPDAAEESGLEIVSRPEIDLVQIEKDSSREANCNFRCVFCFTLLPALSGPL